MCDSKVPAQLQYHVLSPSGCYCSIHWGSVSPSQSFKDRRAAKTAERAAKVDSGTLMTDKKGLTFRDSAKGIQNLNEQQKAGVAAAKVLAEAGLHIEVYASTESERQNGAPNGIYRSSDGTIHIDLNAGDNGQGTVAYALAHETTHFIKDFSPAKYQTYADILIEAAESKGISYDSLLDRQLARLSELRENRSLTAEELQELAYDETIAEMSETMLTDTDAAQRVSQELYKQDRTLWEKIKDFFTGLVEKLRSAYKGVDPDSDIGRVMKRAIQDNETVAQAWAEAVVEAGENYQLQDGTIIGTDGNSADYLYSNRVTDKKTLDFLDGQETVTTYKTMQLVDGKLYPPMAAVVVGSYEDYSELGKWEAATEHPELIKLDKSGKPKFTLNKGKGQGSLAAAYNPYMHSSNLVLNDQFSGAYTRPNLVTVECRVPVSELTSGYKAKYAKDSVGWHSWHTGTVAGALRQQTGTERQVLLSRWIMPVRIVPDAEVAQMYKQLLDGTNIAVPDNVVPPALLTELKKAGVAISESGRIQDGQKNNAREGERYSARQYQADAATFAQEIDQWNRDGMESGARFELGSTGEVLQGLGAIESDIYMNGDKIQKILQEHPEITLNEIKQIPQILNDPTLILKSRNVGRGGRQNTRMVLFGSVKGQNGMPVLTVFDLRPSENHFVLNDMQKVTSAYTKTNGVTFLENSFVLYADKKRTTSLLRTIGFQMPIELLQSGFIGNITYNKQNVNLYGEKFSDVVWYTGERYSSRNVRDSEYMELAKDPEGNSLELEDMVREAAESNGFRYRRQTSRKYAPQNDVQYQMFAEGLDRELWNYGEYAYYGTDSGAIQAEDILPKLRDLSEEFYGETVSDEDLNPPDIVDTAGVWDDPEFVQYMWDNYFEDEFYRTGKVPAVVTEDGMIVLGRDDTRVKSGSNVEYDDDGNVIPLSQRFDTGNEDIRYSNRSSQESQVDRLARKNKELKAEAEYLRQVVQIQKRGNSRNLLDRESVNGIAKGILESVNAKGTEFGKKLNDFYRALQTEEMDYSEMQKLAGELADWALEHHQAERDGYAQEVLDFLKKRRVSLTDSQIGDAEYAYGSLNEFKKAIKGSIIIDQNSTSRK